MLWTGNWHGTLQQTKEDGIDLWPPVLQGAMGNDDDDKYCFITSFLLHYACYCGNFTLLCASLHTDI